MTSMPSDHKSRFAIDAQSIDAASGCEKAHSCLVSGPQCRVLTKMPNIPAAIVCCKEIGACPFKTGLYDRNGEQATLCSCPVRLEFLKQYGI